MKESDIVRLTKEFEGLAIGSKRHGNVPYVKISTSDYGKIKIIAASEKEYKTDGKETANILFRRKK